MEFYIATIVPSININAIEHSLYDWKLYNITTYMNNIIYHNNNFITFYFELNDKLYNFKLIFNSLKWQLELDEEFDSSNLTHNELLNMINIVNQLTPNSEYPNLIMSIIEQQIDETDFNKQDTQEENKCDKQISSEHIYEYERESDINEFDMEYMQQLSSDEEIENYHGFNFTDTNS